MIASLSTAQRSHARIWRDPRPRWTDRRARDYEPKLIKFSPPSLAGSAIKSMAETRRPAIVKAATIKDWIGSPKGSRVGRR
jgi:hypothetical protein